MTEIVAEISGNHGGKLENAIRLIDIAKSCGADAVKFQCFRWLPLAQKRTGITFRGVKLAFDDLIKLYQKTETPREWFPHLIAEANQINIPWFSSVFHPNDVAFLETINCPRYKISAYEMLDGDLINAVVATGKPIVISVRPRPGLTILQASEYGGSVLPLGLSDHTANRDWPKLFSDGSMIERHIRLPDVDTPDAAFSSTPDEFAAYVKAIRP